MHYFLSGDSGIGKSIVLQRTIQLLGYTPGGFYTRFDAPRGSVEKKLFLLPANNASVMKSNYCVAEFKENQPTNVSASKFDSIGLDALKDAEDYPFIVMDECGRLERGAKQFQERIWGLLGRDIPILGVLHYKPARFPLRIRNHYNVRVIEVTEKNRDMLPVFLAGELIRYMPTSAISTRLTCPNIYGRRVN